MQFDIKNLKPDLSNIDTLFDEYFLNITVNNDRIDYKDFTIKQVICTPFIIYLYPSLFLETPLMADLNVDLSVDLKEELIFLKYKTTENDENVLLVVDINKWNFNFKTTGNYTKYEWAKNVKAILNVYKTLSQLKNNDSNTKDLLDLLYNKLNPDFIKSEIQKEIENIDRKNMSVEEFTKIPRHYITDWKKIPFNPEEPDIVVFTQADYSEKIMKYS